MADIRPLGTEVIGAAGANGDRPSTNGSGPSGGPAPLSWLASPAGRRVVLAGAGGLGLLAAVVLLVRRRGRH